jgi:hypothetical protein
MVDHLVCKYYKYHRGGHIEVKKSKYQCDREELDFTLFFHFSLPDYIKTTFLSFHCEIELLSSWCAFRK